MIRDDLSNKLIHLIRGDNLEVVSNTFLKIIEEGILRSGTGCIKGGFSCVCFSEAPISKLTQILALPSAHGARYKPFGIMVEKEWLFERGGRPVIYQTDQEYEFLHLEQRYRHVRYEPNNRIDFTWEREWRVKTSELILQPNNATLVVPTRYWERMLRQKHMEIIQAAIAGLGDSALAYAEEYPWHFIVLDDLGVDIPND